MELVMKVRKSVGHYSVLTLYLSIVSDHDVIRMTISDPEYVGGNRITGTGPSKVLYYPIIPENDSKNTLQNGV